jgi:hypothetical protein
LPDNRDVKYLVDSFAKHSIYPNLVVVLSGASIPMSLTFSFFPLKITDMVSPSITFFTTIVSLDAVGVVTFASVEYPLADKDRINIAQKNKLTHSNE